MLDLLRFAPAAAFLNSIPVSIRNLLSGILAAESTKPGSRPPIYFFNPHDSIFLVCGFLFPFDAPIPNELTYLL